MIRIDSIKEAIGISLQKLNRTDEDRKLWVSVIHESPGVKDYSMTHYTQSKRGNSIHKERSPNLHKYSQLPSNYRYLA